MPYPFTSDELVPVTDAGCLWGRRYEVIRGEDRRGAQGYRILITHGKGGGGILYVQNAEFDAILRLKNNVF